MIDFQKIFTKHFIKQKSIQLLNNIIDCWYTDKLKFGRWMLWLLTVAIVIGMFFLPIISEDILLTNIYMGMIITECVGFIILFIATLIKFPGPRKEKL